MKKPPVKPFTERALNFVVKRLIRIACRIDASQLARVPPTGPLLLVTNHVNFLDMPVIGTHLQPRPLTGFAKAETWDNPILALMFNIWGGIPIRRGTSDMRALRQGLAVLEAGYILGVAPEGTRSGDGVLGKAHPGVVTLAVHSGAPLLPLACYGAEAIWENFKRFKRTDFNIAVGYPFYVRADLSAGSRELRRAVLDEIMYQLAALLPQRYRGIYADLDQASERYLQFPEGSQSNLSLSTR